MSQENHLKPEHVQSHPYSDQPTVLHITHWKAGSQWVYNILDALTHNRVIIPQPKVAQVLQQPIIPGMVYPTIYVTRDQFQSIEVPENHIKFFVMRDIRDTLISWYFSMKYSHPLMYLTRDRRREELNNRSLEEGLRHGMHTFLPLVADVQRSWCNSNILTFRYEEMLVNALNTFRYIANYCHLDVSDAQLEAIVNKFSFKEQAKRAPGEENINSHFRKGVAGDWQTYLTGDLLVEFKAHYDTLLIETGYEDNRDWGLDLMSRKFPLGPVEQIKNRAGKRTSCWCGNKDLEPYSSNFYRCNACHSLICQTDVTLDDLIVTQEEDDLYGLNYWQDPYFYSHHGGSLNEHAVYQLFSRNNIEILRTILKYRPGGGRVLEIGCGSGALSFLIQRAGYDVTALEMSPAVAAFGQKRFGIDIRIGPLERQTFAAGSFDIAVINNVLEHFPDPESTLTLCAKLLASGGLVLLRLSQFNDNRAYDDLNKAGSKLIRLLRPVEHMHLFSSQGFQLLLDRVGFSWRANHEAGVIVAAREPLLMHSTAEVMKILSTDSNRQIMIALFGLDDSLLRAERRSDEDRAVSFSQMTQILNTVEWKTANTRQLNIELNEKEAIIRRLNRYRMTSVLFYLQLLGRFSMRIPILGWLIKQSLRLIQLMRRWMMPRLGTLEQYPPRPLQVSGPYEAKAVSIEELPVISIVTPSFNQERFIEDTIRSVLDQDYPHLEYVIQDGASTDETASILDAYADRLTAVDSSPDTGQANAINKGFARTSGTVLAYLNSDDMLLPGTLQYVGEDFATHPNIDVVYGHRVLIDEHNAEIGRWILPRHSDEALSWADYIPQETMFWRRDIWEAAGDCMDETFQFALDWDLLLRFREAGAQMRRLPRFLGAFRVHTSQKTSTTISHDGQLEMARLRERCHGHPVETSSIVRGLMPYLLEHVILHNLYRLRIVKYE